MNYSVTEAESGWKRVSVTFEAEKKPKWWKFWEAEIPKQTMTASFWVKSEVIIPTLVETFNTKEK